MNNLTTKNQNTVSNLNTSSDNTNWNKITELAENVIKLSRNTLLVNLRFLDASINELVLNYNYEIDTIMCEGKIFLFNPKYILISYRDEKERPTHDYMHVLLHCIFRHMFINTLVDQELWDLACDIAVESTLIDLHLPALNIEKLQQEEKYIEELKSKNIKITAEKLYAHILNKRPSDNELERLKKIFFSDDHSIWYMNEKEKQKIVDAVSGATFTSRGLKNAVNEATEAESGNDQAGESSSSSGSGDELSDSLQNGLNAQANRWQEISERMQEEITSFVDKKQGFGSGSMMQNLKEVNRERYDYTSFLKKFAVMGEAMTINDDEFDYIFYTYGLKLYDNIPLIEPLEYKDVKKIREFVIAIDTSGSVMGEEVQSFLTKTYNILLSEESFFKKINVHIIQCDADIQEDKVIHSKEEFTEYLKIMTLKGFGGTDFRPVFEYVDSLIQNKVFTNLKGLIYFTDGYGTFPKKQPDYQTAFVFVDDGYEVPEVPSWAIKLKLEKEDLKG